MPRDGSGIYSLPNAAFVPSTTIASAAVNGDLADLVADANAARPVTAGGSGSTTTIGAFDKFATAGTTILSASTTNLDTATGPLVDISGTATATAITLGAGKVRIVRATGAFTLTASSSLVVNGSTSTPYTAVVGDLLLFEGYAAGVVQVWVVSPQPQDLSSFITASSTNTLTNKRITPRIVSTTSSSTPTPNADTTDQYEVTALAAGATFGAPTGTPTDGQKLIIRIKDAGTAETLAWNAIYRAVGVTLPTTTVISKTLYLGAIYNSADTKWDVIAVAQQ